MLLIDGNPNGRMQCELSNWTGKAYRIPKKQLKICGDRPDLDHAGIYILFGRTDDRKETAYIGEADCIRKRLQQHSKKEFWNEVIIFISKDNNLNKGHIRYLEKRLCEMATQAERYILKNANNPGIRNISESDQAEMEEFIDNLKILINALGFKIFESLREENPSESDENKNLFHIEAIRGVNARGQSTSEGFVVLKGSSIAESVTNSFPKNNIELRNRLIEEKIIVDHIFTKDYLFSSPSTAASIVMGRSANGLTEWRLEDGRVLKSVEA